MSDVVLHAYNAQGSLEYSAMEYRLGEALGTVALRIDHIGSTAVPGLAAKPIIDIQISVASLDPVEAYSANLQEVGFVWRPDNPERTKRYFREAPGEKRTHIHVREQGSFSEQFALLFRDYLRNHADDRILYESKKRALANSFTDDREAYTAGKAPVIWDIMGRAHQWAARTGWRA